MPVPVQKDPDKEDPEDINNSSAKFMETHTYGGIDQPAGDNMQTTNGSAQFQWEVPLSLTGWEKAKKRSVVLHRATHLRCIILIYVRL